MKRVFFRLCGAIGCALAVQFPATAIAKSTETVIYSFCSVKNCADGNGSLAGLVDVNGVLYGTTEWGGTHCRRQFGGCGTVFSVNATTGTEAAIYSFCSQKKCKDGMFPAASLINIKGTLYGATPGGGTQHEGTAFALNPSTGAETVLHSFGTSGGDGADGWASLIDVNGTLYGTTCCGGANANGGTVFAINRKTGAETVVYSFCSQTNCTDGAGPLASLIEVNGALYGTTSVGGANEDCVGFGCGTVFSVDPATGAETVVYSFCRLRNCKDGAGPSAGLINVNGTLYGTTEGGGSDTRCSDPQGYAGCGTVFSIDPATGTETVLHSFHENGKDGWAPLAGLIDVKGILYGTTQLGGSNTSCGFGGQTGCGTVFAIDLSTLTEKVLYSFCSQANCTDGMFPLSNLIAVNGALYGTTEQGGTNCPSSNGCGTVFAIKNP